VSRHEAWGTSTEIEGLHNGFKVIEYIDEPNKSYKIMQQIYVGVKEELGKQTQHKEIVFLIILTWIAPV